MSSDGLLIVLAWDLCLNARRTRAIGVTIAGLGQEKAERTVL